MNLYVWLRGDSNWDFDLEEADNEKMLGATYEKDEEDLSIEHLLKDGEPTAVKWGQMPALSIAMPKEAEKALGDYADLWKKGMRSSQASTS